MRRFILILLTCYSINADAQLDSNIRALMTNLCSNIWQCNRWTECREDTCTTSEAHEFKSWYVKIGERRSYFGCHDNDSCFGYDFYNIGYTIDPITRRKEVYYNSCNSAIKIITVKSGFKNVYLIELAGESDFGKGELIMIGKNEFLLHLSPNNYPLEQFRYYKKIHGPIPDTKLAKAIKMFK